MPTDVEPAGTGLLLREIKERGGRVEKLRRMFRDSWQAFDVWRTKAQESYEFCGNSQWMQADLLRLGRQRRPSLTLNQILAPVLWLTGLQRQQRQETKVLPFEGGDVRSAELMNGLVKHVSGRSQEADANSWIFQDKVITGMGFKKLTVDFTETPEGELRWIRCNPLTVFPDPNFLESRWENAKYVGHAFFQEMAELINEFPEHEMAIRQKYGDWLAAMGTSTSSNLWVESGGEQVGDPFASQRTFWDPETQRARVVEIWYAEMVKVKVLLNRDTYEVQPIPEEETKQVQGAAQSGMLGNVVVVERPVRQVRVAKILDDVLLSDGPSPFDSPFFPIFPAIGHYFWEFPYGIVEYQKDPQRLFNKTETSMAELIARMPHSGFMNHRTKGAKSSELVDYANGNGVVIQYEEAPPTHIDPPQLDQTLVYQIKSMQDLVMRIVNINTEQLGSSSQRTVSGRAIEARQRSGLLVQEPLLDTFDFEMTRATEFLIQVIPQFITPMRARRILGTLAARSPELSVSKIVTGTDDQQTSAMELDELLSGAFEQRYDVVVKTIPWEPSLMAQRWQTLLELFQSSPTLPDGTPSIPLDLMAEAARDAGILTKDAAQRVIANYQRATQLAGPQQTPTPQGLMQGTPEAPAGAVPPTIQ